MERPDPHSRESQTGPQRGRVSIEKARRVFSQFAITASDGETLYLPVVSAVRCLRLVGFVPTESDIRDVKKAALDGGADGNLTFERFLKLTRTVMPMPTREEVVACFHRLDKANRGSLTRAQLKNALLCFGPHINSAEAGALVDFVDADSSGMVSFEKAAEMLVPTQRVCRTLVVFYSTFGHTQELALAATQGAQEFPSSEVTLRRIPETLGEETLDRMGASRAQEEMARIPVIKPDEFQDYDCIIIVTPTRFGGAPAQVQAVFDGTGSIWSHGGLVGRVGTVMVATATQHGGHETTVMAITSMMMHHGMVVVGCPQPRDSWGSERRTQGGGCYGAGTLTGSKGERMPSEYELQRAKDQARMATAAAHRLIS